MEKQRWSPAWVTDLSPAHNIKQMPFAVPLENSFRLEYLEAARV
jgi:hypothetical protein